MSRGPWRALTWTPQEDAAIRKIYARPDRASIRANFRNYRPALAGRRPDQIYRRALVLGVTQPNTQQRRWTDAELQMLEMHAHKRPQSIRLIFKQAGWERSQASIAIAIQRHLGGVREVKLGQGLYCAAQAGAALGVTNHAVLGWIKNGWLPARRGSGHGPHQEWVIAARSLRQFAIDYTAHVNFTRLDKFAFMDLICPSHGRKGAAKEAA